MSKPWPPHKFVGMTNRPLSCTTCSQTEDHENHKGRKYPRRGMSKVVKKPDWQIYGGSNPVRREPRAPSPSIPQPQNGVPNFPLAVCGRCGTTEHLRVWGRVEENDPTSEIVYFCHACWALLEP